MLIFHVRGSVKLLYLTGLITRKYLRTVIKYTSSKIITTGLETQSTAVWQILYGLNKCT
jgi:hypothetical protein